MTMLEFFLINITRKRSFYLMPWRDNVLTSGPQRMDPQSLTLKRRCIGPVGRRRAAPIDIRVTFHWAVRLRNVTMFFICNNFARYVTERSRRVGVAVYAWNLVKNVPRFYDQSALKLCRWRPSCRRTTETSCATLVALIRLSVTSDERTVEKYDKNISKRTEPISYLLYYNYIIW